jgi:hypothetical protein
MPAGRSLRTDVRYVLTDEGREALLRAPRCECSQLFVSDGVYACHVCDTVYSVVFGFTVTPRRLQPSVHR